MSGEIHEAPIVHGVVSCSSLHVETLGMNVSVTGIDASITESGNLVENRAFSTAIENVKRDEFNFSLTGDFDTSVNGEHDYESNETNTFSQNPNSLHTFNDGFGITIPASGLYLSTFMFNANDNSKEKIISLGADQYLEMTDPQSFQANSSSGRVRILTLLLVI